MRTRALFPRPFLLCAVFAVLATLLVAEIVPRYAPGLLRFEHMLGDVRTAYLSDRLPSQHPHVAIVSITDETLKDSKVRQPIDRALLARLVDAVDAAGAKVIGIDILSRTDAARRQREPADRRDQARQGARSFWPPPTSASTCPKRTSTSRRSSSRRSAALPATSIWPPSGTGSIRFKAQPLAGIALPEELCRAAHRELRRQARPVASAHRVAAASPAIAPTPF